MVSGSARPVAISASATMARTAMEIVCAWMARLAMISTES
jgi:hypothetical protein